MRNSGKTIVLAFIIGLCFVLPAAAQKTRSDFQKMYMTFLQKEGCTPSIDSDGDINFKYRGRNYYILVKDDDPQLFVVMENIDMENTPRQKSIEAANYTNRRSYVTSVSISQDGKIGNISAEILLLKPADFKNVFSRIMSLILETEERFASQL